MANAYTMTVGELIDAAFGDTQCARIDFNLVETIIYLIASKLRILDREVFVESGSSISSASRKSSTIVVSEIKLRTLKYKKVRDDRPHGHGSDKKSSEHVYHVQKVKTDYGESTKSKQQRSKDTASSEKTKKLQSEEKNAEFKDDSTKDLGPRDKKAEKEVHVFKVTSTKKTGAKPKLSTIESRSESEKESGGADSKTKTRKLKSPESDMIPDETQKYYNMLEKLEEQRERVLRVIRQRADSHEEAMHTPSPMTSMKSSEIEFEKLLVVEKAKEGQGDPRPTTDLQPTLSMVTRDKFNELLDKVMQLQQRFNLADHPDHLKLLEKLRQGISLSDILAAVQITSRLEAAEKAIHRITRILSGLHHTETFSILHKTDSLHQIPEALMSGFIIKPVTSSQLQIHSDTVLVESTHELPQINKVYITRPEMQEALAKLYEDLIQPISVTIETHTADIEKTANKALALDRKIADLSSIIQKVENVENTVQSFIHQMNAIDAGLTSQLTSALEQMTRLQFDLEAGLESIHDAAVHQGIDAEEMATMTGNFHHLQKKIDQTMDLQKDLHGMLEKLGAELQFLRAEHEMLRDSKCDREEFADALRDKVGLEKLNNMIAEETFISVIGDMHDRLEDFRQRIFTQELTWQKTIEDLQFTLHNKLDTKYLNAIREDMSKHLSKFKKRLDEILAIVGEPLSAVVTRSIYRDTMCLSCCNPAHVKPPDNKVPALPKFKPQENDDTAKPKEDPDTESCIPGLKILHRIDPRAKICSRYCGGAHTMQKKQPKLTETLNIERVQKPNDEDDVVNAEEGKKSKKSTAKPCIHCNMKAIYAPTYDDSDDTKSTTRLISFSQKSFRESTHSCMIPPLNPAQHQLHSLSAVNIN